MPIGGYLGVSNSPREIKDIYIGVNNQPRRVMKAYIGDEQNRPRLWYYYYPPAPLDYDSVYYMNGTGTFTTFGGRTYNKQNTGEAYVCSAWTPSGWTFHILVSQYKKAVENWSSYNSSSIAGSQGSFIMYDHLWYFSMGHYDWQGIFSVSPQNNHIDFRNNPNIPAVNDVDAYEKMSKEFLKIIYDTIPEMTSNSSPRGQVIYSDLQGVTGVGTNVIAAGTDKSYYVFTRDNTVGIAHMNENVYGYIEYDFDHSVSVSEVDFSAGVGSMSGYYKDFIVRIDLYTNNTWSTYGRSTISSPKGVLPAPMSNYTVQNGTVYNVTKIRLTFETMKTYGNGVVMNKIQIKN